MPATAGILVRISDDRTGDALGVERQEQDCRAVAERRGWAVGRVYRENDTSAFQRRKVLLPDGTTALRVLRPAFRELLDDIASGTITALVAYDLDRVARDPRDLEDLIDAVEHARIPTAAVTGEIDLSTDNGIFMARMLVNVANKSSRDTSRRVRRAILSLAEEGRPSGGARPFGYEDDKVTVRENEAEAVRWMHEQAAAGRSLRSIGLDLAVRYPERLWDNDSVRRLLTSARNAGLRVHRGQVIGPASWPGIVTPEERERTIDTLDDRNHPSRQVGGPRRYLLTGLLYCGACGGQEGPWDRRLYPRRNAARQRFGCLPKPAGGCAGSIVVYEPAEESIVTAVLERLRHVEPSPVVDDPTGHLRAEIARLEQEQRALGEQLAADPTAVLMLQAANRVMADKIEALREQVRHAHQAQRVADPAGVADSWPRLDPDQRRAVVEAVIDRVIVGPHAGGPRFTPSRLTIVWR